MRTLIALASLVLLLSGCTCGQATVACHVPEDCLPDKPYCAEVEGTCVGCLNDAHCAAGDICGAGGVCEPGCRSATDRCSLGQQCKSGVGCVQCTADTQCDHGQICTTNKCVTGCSAQKLACPAGLVCDETKSTCVSCLASAQCTTPGLGVCIVSTAQPRIKDEVSAM